MWGSKQSKFGSSDYLSGRSSSSSKFDAIGPIIVLLVLHSCFSLSAAVEEVITERLAGQMREQEGTVTFKPPLQVEIPARVPQQVSFGDGLRTYAAARATVLFNDW